MFKFQKNFFFKWVSFTSIFSIAESLAFVLLDGASVTIFLGIRVMFASSNFNKLEIYILWTLVNDSNNSCQQFIIDRFMAGWLDGRSE